MFHRTRTNLTQWFLAAYLMGRDKRGVSAKFLQRELGVAHQTAWTMATSWAERSEGSYTDFRTFLDTSVTSAWFESATY